MSTNSSKLVNFIFKTPNIQIEHSQSLLVTSYFDASPV